MDRALAAVGDFADLVSPDLVGHSAGVARLAAEAGRHCGLADGVVRDLRRAGAVHDVGRVAISAGVWRKPRPLSPDEWEQVRLHAYHGERALSRSPFLSMLLTVAFTHHERLDGSGYHRGSTAAALPLPARLLAAADVYQALTEPRPHREALSPARAGEVLRAEAAAERLDVSSVTAVLAAAGQPASPAGAPLGPHRSRDRGAGARRSRAADEAGRPRARHLPEDRGSPPRARLREDRRLDAGSRRRLRHGARPSPSGLTAVPGAAGTERSRAVRGSAWGELPMFGAPCRS